MDFDEARARMVDEQLMARGIRAARLLDAMRRVPRHLFVPRDQQPLAYTDRALPIAGNQTISQPFMVATMTEALAVEPASLVLEVGTGSGYQAAVLSLLAKEVLSIERRPELAAAAAATLRSLGYGNVKVIVGDGTLGAPELAPFDGILVTAGAPRVPAALLDQLRDQGRLVIPVGPPAQQEVVVVTRDGDRFEESRREGCVFVPLIGAAGWPEA
ncbi:MAG TPA: protein-L-isoaspartate(D-aspartate) O-methyltransferase [Vicinamibacterales bacterium]